MKKLALSALTSFAIGGVAHAQSSVTIYGILDTGYVGGNVRSATVASNGAQSKTTVNLFGQNAESSSRLGFKGLEDLGGGSSAFFTTEMQLYPQDPTVSGSANAGFFNRQTFLGLRKNGLGEGAIGLQYTPIFKAALVTDPGNLNNITGNLIYASTQGVGSASAGTTAIGFTARTANTLSFKTDNFYGFTASGIYSLNNKNQSQTTTSNAVTGGNVNANGWGLAADYTYKSLYITAAYQALKQQTTAVTSITDSAPWTNAATNTGTLPNTAGNALNVQDNQFYVAGTYDFGFLKAYAQYLTRKATSSLSSSYYLGRAAEQLGVRGFITPTIEGWASAGLGRYTEMGPGSPTANFTGFQLGSNYWLSKRTNLYAMYGQTIVSTGIATNGILVNAAISNYAVGVRHTF
ncbi:porin [Polynucleobacter sp. MWH-Braz-FAM2G]|uniref:porin n=1 Tax=Polynucleobacter sp. MWH-Braz-FAM2G TaxID=1855883 RepID=UPI001BFD32A6|nr:porin [Polynucleobacter sp. MWH-Braz-FAM2G]QWD90235.1 porin [Polynucleobacter sp. MWH-Braz-FAM2G]